MGILITLEGGEGVGKSTLALGLERAFQHKKIEVLRTREPGGSPGADAIRHLLVASDAPSWSALSEALLFCAARNDHLEKTIRPALQRGAVVICDRYIDSTLAYQSAAGGVTEPTLRALFGLLSVPTPDLTLVLDMEAKNGLARSRGAQLAEDRFEKKGEAFHERVRAAFLEIVRKEPDRCVLVDASQSADLVLENALEQCRLRLKLAL